ncbi:MAG: glutamate--tRNA ligase [Clostridia bacterium]|nr:glutamate--tRNA ligase [Deltaproteobacteria bacterium]
MTAPARPVRVRIAPSPTGDPHVGTAYIALFNYVFAKKHGGKFILRIEDTDQTRSRPEWETMIQDALRWTGVSWDEGPDIGGKFGPYRQSERTAHYVDAAKTLVNSGAAYPCFCTSERLEQLRRDQLRRKVSPGYDGRCRALSAEEVNAKLSDGLAHTVRLKIPKEGATTFVDKLRGEVTIENHTVDDQVLLKSDGFPTYHLANVVDDHMMEITHVMRAEEWITSTPKHVLLYRAFGWEAPEWIHMPLLRNADKSKISKRKNPVSINYYKQAGFLPEALLNYLAMMGWTMPDAREKFTVAEMIEQFDLTRISLGGPVFDVKKLTWLNGRYIREMSTDEIVRRIRENILTDEKLRAVMPLVHERIEKLEDFIDHVTFFFNGDVSYDAEATAAMVPKGQTAGAVATTLETVLEALDVLPVLADAPALEGEMRAIADRFGLKAKDLFMPLRVAVTGRKATPPLFESMIVLGKERCRRRIRNAIAHLKMVDEAQRRAAPPSGVSGSGTPATGARPPASDTAS